MLGISPCVRRFHLVSHAGGGLSRRFRGFWPISTTLLGEKWCKFVRIEQLTPGNPLWHACGTGARPQKGQLVG